MIPWGFVSIANGFWLPDHATPEQANAIALAAFKRTVVGQLELLDLDTTC